eukprot:3949365-Prymnesium_polylepis.2
MSAADITIGRLSEPRRVRCSRSCASSSTPITLVVLTKVRNWKLLACFSRSPCGRAATHAEAPAHKPSQGTTLLAQRRFSEPRARPTLSRAALARRGASRAQNHPRGRHAPGNRPASTAPTPPASRPPARRDTPDAAPR